MESSATLSTPRLRLSRNPHTLERFLPSASHDHFPEPAAVLADEDLDGNDRDDDQESTPKMSSTALLDATETPAARLRALLALSPASSKSTPMPLPPSRSSDIDSDFEPLDASYESTPSAARESLKDIFSRAMRDPGNTPRKGKFKPRRNSIDTSEVDASPRVERQRNENKGKRKSLSDEEADPAKTSETSFRSSQAATFDILRERLINSHSQLKDLRLPESTYQDSVPDDDNDAIQFSRDTNLTTTTPPVATSTPQQSLHMFIDSHLPSQSNLLDRDSEMQRAFEGFDSSDTDGASQRPVSFPPSAASAYQTQKPPSSQLTRTLKSLLSRETYTINSSHASTSDAKGQHAKPRFGISRSILGENHKANDLSLEEDLSWSRTSAQPHIPDESRQSAITQPPLSVPSVGPSSSRNGLGQRDFDEVSSEESSSGSQVDHQEKTAEFKKERKVGRERDWDKPRSSRPTLRFGLNLPSTDERSRTRSLTQNDSKSLVPGTIQRHHSPTASPRPSSPAGSLVSNNDDEAVHEKERKWNAKWDHDSPQSISPLKTQSSGTITIEENSKPLAARKGVSPQRSQTITKSRSKNDSTTSVSATSVPRPSLSPHSPHRHTRSHKLQSNGTTLPRSPSPSTAKGKGKVLDQSSFSEVHTALLDFSLPERNSPPTIKPGSSLSPGFSFVRKRTPLEPIEFETDLGQKARRDLLSLSTRSGASAKLNNFLIRSTQDLELPDNLSIQSSPPVTNVKSASFHSESSSVSDTNSKPLFNVSSMLHADQDGPSKVRDPSQEQVATIEAEPLPQTLEYTQNRPSSPSQLSTGKSEQSRTNLQQKLDSDSSGLMSQKLQQYSPLPSPPSQSPPRDLHIKPISPLLTPPRRPSTSRVEFQTPSPPRNIPDLPGPPTSSEDEVEEESTPAPFGYPRPDLTAVKTPRLPGAWTFTPAPLRKTSRLPLSESGIEHGEMNNRLQTADHDSRPNMNTAEVATPFGSRASITIPLSSPKQNLPHSGNSEEEFENGLTTPGTSFFKGSLSYAKTPAPPGAYMVTPAGRKSVARVRFDGVNDSDSKDSIIRDPLENITNASSSNATPRTTLPQMDIPSRMRTLDLSTPNSPASRRAKSQTSAGIRVLDAFGREYVKDEAGKAENNVLQNGIRVVDALGREVDNDQSSHLTTEGNISELSTPLKHGEALLRVRQGLSDLVNGLDEMDKQEQSGQESDFSRLQQLQQASVEARAARARVSAAISSNAEDIERKLKPLQTSMNKLSIYSTGGRLWQVSWIICFFLIMQLGLIAAMYRISAIRARELFLTTYYDPFYPDLHLYITKSDTIQFSMHSLTKASWFTLPHTFYSEGWKASALQIWHNLSIIIRNWQELLWDKVVDGSPQITNWPPT